MWLITWMTLNDLEEVLRVHGFHDYMVLDIHNAHRIHKVLRFYRIHGFHQGGRTWQPFVGGKNVHENFRQARIYNFRDKCVVFARNRKFANLTQ